MASAETGKPVAGRTADGLSKTDRRGGPISDEHTCATAEAQGDRPLIGANGRTFSTAILRNWSASALRALDIRWAETGELVDVDPETWPAPRTRRPQTEAGGQGGRP